ncbi:MAG: tyrosine-type recombinase/integrase [Bacteroidia bacterium]|nr:tyrosine-type recombinase/integrase [Bacteroidia bacterium]
MGKAKFKLILGRRKNYPLHLELEVYKGADCRVLISTGIVLESESQWDNARQIIIKNSNAEQYNKYIRQLIERIVDLENISEKNGEPLTPEAIKMAAKSQTAKGEDVFKVFARYVEEDKSIRYSTKKQNLTFIRAAHGYIRYYKNSPSATLYFGEVSVNIIKSMNQYLLERLGSRSVYDIHVLLRKQFRHAVKDGLIGGNPYDHFEIKSCDKKNRQGISEAHLGILENIFNSKGYTNAKQEVVLDMFLFTCYTGLRISDVKSLKKQHIQKEAQGYVLHKRTIKTGIEVTLPLYSIFNGKAQAIVDKYIDSEDRDAIFPYVSRYAIDHYLHKLGEMLELPFTLTHHIARHTCASLLAERADNPFVIMSVLGHGDIKTSMRYIHTSHKTAAKKLEAIKWESDMTAEEIAQADNDLASMCDLVRAACEKKKLSQTLTRFTLGVVNCNVDKGQLIADWIGKIRKTDYSIEAFGKRLEMLVE